MVFSFYGFLIDSVYELVYVLFGFCYSWFGFSKVSLANSIYHVSRFMPCFLSILFLVPFVSSLIFSLLLQGVLFDEELEPGRLKTTELTLSSNFILH